ncbi:CRISPR-associated endonuclease Cas1 [Methylopila jiangsuensis]|uniref:CRISPR-associated endonuclease Cas1 n=1 Tax=Methylopila jiangsuensis TaxID=586230 RepID=A0A9W6JJB2_9HYPH|nr:type II CRISPR-associated endonuclease Cas1 [Methylopila jiangsuensis]MDR6284373.1 CRISPR-associated protein Cas1 [Methylopila jiangsuensis]GLK78242.1 CRISPR-associated endonuclease Cas1 [Methylopila jiangsuensis]
MERVVDISVDGRHLRAHRGFLLVSEAGVEVGRVPLDDVAAVIVHAHGVTWTANLVSALAERGAPLVFCGSNHAPVAVCLPIDGHHGQNARMRAQWEAGRPLSKQLWREIVMAKIRWQGAALSARGQSGEAFELIARRVKSGDPENVEAQAARRYWPALMGPDFRRDRGADGVNALLNYGYTVLRALCARSLVAAGLHPSIGVHHANRGNAFALADDLIEPFRPLVDLVAAKLADRGAAEVNPEAKRAFAALIALDLPGEAGVTTVAMAAQRSAQSLARAFETGRVAELALPRAPSPLELAGLAAMDPLSPIVAAEAEAQR